MSGYNWNEGMSNNAVAAYNSGEMPYSKWTKKDILDNFYYPETREILAGLSLKDLKEDFLLESSWHHTSKFFNKTSFYEFDSSCEDLTPEKASEFLEDMKKWKKADRAFMENRIHGVSVCFNGKTYKCTTDYVEGSSWILKSEGHRLEKAIIKIENKYYQDLYRSKFSSQVFDYLKKTSKFYEINLKEGDLRIDYNHYFQRFDGTRWVILERVDFLDFVDPFDVHQILNNKNYRDFVNTIEINQYNISVDFDFPKRPNRPCAKLYMED